MLQQTVCVAYQTKLQYSKLLKSQYESSSLIFDLLGKLVKMYILPRKFYLKQDVNQFLV